jgi:hypothetical protein
MQLHFTFDTDEKQDLVARAAEKLGWEVLPAARTCRGPRRKERRFLQAQASPISQYHPNFSTELSFLYAHFRTQKGVAWGKKAQSPQTKKVITAIEML